MDTPNLSRRGFIVASSLSVAAAALSQSSLVAPAFVSSKGRFRGQTYTKGDTQAVFTDVTDADLGCRIVEFDRDGNAMSDRYITEYAHASEIDSEYDGVVVTRINSPYRVELVAPDWCGSGYEIINQRQNLLLTDAVTNVKLPQFG